MRCAQSGLIEAISLAAGELSDLAVLPDIAPPGPRLVVADRNDWSPLVTEDLARDDVTLGAPFRSATYDPTPEQSVVLGRLRRRIETTCAHLVERDQAKQVWARDLWQFGNRLVRKVLSHTIAVTLNADLGNPPLQSRRPAPNISSGRCK